MGAAGSPHLLFVEGEPCVPPPAAFRVTNTSYRPPCVCLPALLLKCCGTRAQAAAAAVLLLQAPCARHHHVVFSAPHFPACLLHHLLLLLPAPPGAVPICGRRITIPSFYTHSGYDIFADPEADVT